MLRVMFKQISRDAALVLLGFVAAVAISSRAQVTLDLGAGECRYTKAPEGQWYQSEFQTSVRTIDNCQSVGFSAKAFTSWTFGLHYATLGSVAIESQAVTCPNDDCHKTRDMSKDFYRADCKPHFNEDNCAYSWVSGGNAKGALTTAAYRAFNIGALGFDLRGGLYFHQLKYASVVENLECRDSPNCRIATIVQRTHFAVAPVLGLGLKYSPGFLHGGFAGVTWDRFFRIGDRIEMTAGFKGPTDRMMIWAGLPL